MRTPSSELPNKSRLLAELNEMKLKTRKKRKEFWMRRSEQAASLDFGGVSKVRVRSVALILGQIRKPFFNSNQRILPMRIP